MRWFHSFSRSVVAAGDGGGPEDVERLGGLVVEEFGSPTVLGLGLVLHHGDGPLLAPVDEVGRGGIADDAVVPTRGPYHVERAVFALHDAWVAQQPVVAYRGCHHRATVVEGGPVQSVVTVGQVQSVALSYEIGEEVDVFGPCGGDPHQGRQDEGEGSFHVASDYG